MSTILRDAVRGLHAGKGTTLLAFAMFALAVAAGTVTYSVVDTVALRRLPFADPNRLVAIPRIEARTGGLAAAAPQDFFAWRDHVSALESLGMYRNNVVLAWQSGGAPLQLSVARVTTNFFDVLGARPVLGRLFGPEHDVAGNDAVIVLSHALWMRAFGSDPGVIGRSIVVGPGSRQIVGVLQPKMTYPVGLETPTDAYIPSVATAAERTDASPGRTYNASIVGRLRPGATMEQAQQQIDAIDTSRMRSTAASATTRVHLVVPLLDRVVGDAKSWLLLVLAGVGCLLLVACVNVANLFLARATIRTRELATREVLGASRRRIAITLVAEGLLLSLAAGLAGVVAAFWGVGVVKSMLPQGLARAAEIRLDGRVLAASLGAVTVCGLAFATAPAWLVSRLDLFTATRTSSGSVIGGRQRSRSLAAFLVGECAFVSALLTATALVVTSFVLLTTTDLGFDRHNVFAIGIQKTIDNVANADRAAAVTATRTDLLQRIRAVPGVANAAIIENGVPLGGGSQYSIRLPGDTGPMNDRMFEVREVTSEYFATMKMQLVQGRGLEQADWAGAPPVGVIDEAAARKYFARANPIGQVLTFRGPVTIVGVVHSPQLYGPDVTAGPQLYLALEQAEAGTSEVGGDLVVRSNGPSAALASIVRDVARNVLRGGDVFQPRFIDDVFARLTAGRRFNAGLMAIFGAIALVIGAIGIYGTMAFVVAQDVRAIGLRMALGATPARIRRGVLIEAVRRVAIGAVIGLGGAWAASGLLTSLVFGVRPTSVVVYAEVAVFMIVVGVGATLGPALRACRLDPLTALRSE